MKPFESIEVIRINSSVAIDESLLCNKELPVVIRGYDIGGCLSKWTPEYLKEKGGSRPVKVHRSAHASLDFRNKNFAYETVGFSELIRRCRGELSTSGDLLEKENTSSFWYLRSLGEDPRGRDISDLQKHFPDLSADINIPPVFPPESFFSSVFRISSRGLQLWTHYDTCHNILIQIQGRKRVVFYPPSEALNLYLDGDKSAVLDIDNPDLNDFPKFAQATRYEAVLEEGDVVFIPALWFHNVTALDFSISVNVFWKNLSESLYDKKDTYGNRDLIPAQLGFQTLEKAAAQLKKLPPVYEDFYLRRMIVSLEKRVAKLQASKVE